MTVQSMNCGERFVAHSAEILANYGVSLSIGHDFSLYRKILADVRPDHLIGMPFDPDIHDLTGESAFWILGHNAAGEVIHTQAIRMLDIGASHVGDYFRHNFLEFPPPGVNLDLKRCRYRAGPGAMRMRGRVAYHGEFWIGGNAGAYRGTGLSCVLSRYGFWHAIQTWDPDHILAFMVKAVAFKGLAERAGWMHTEPGALRWFIQGRDAPVEGFMAYMDREDLHYLLDLPMSDLLEMAA